MQSWWMTNKSALIVGQIRTCGVATEHTHARARRESLNEKLETRFNWSRSVGWPIENGSNDFPESSKPAACHASLRGNESKPIIIANCLILALRSECRVISSRKQEAVGLPIAANANVYSTQSGRMQLCPLRGDAARKCRKRSALCSI